MRTGNGDGKGSGSGDGDAVHGQLDKRNNKLKLDAVMDVDGLPSDAA